MQVKLKDQMLYCKEIITCIALIITITSKELIIGAVRHF